MSNTPPTTRQRRASFAALVGVTLVIPRLALAAPPTGPPVVTDSGAESCPRAQDVQAEIVRLVPPEELHRLDPPVRVQVDDGGEFYVVRVFDGTAETAREHRDEGRHCAARARFAAVFAVLRLMPPEVMLSLEQPATQNENEADGGEVGTDEKGTETGGTTSDSGDERRPVAATKPAAAPPDRQADRPGPGIGAAARYGWITPVGGAIDYLVPGVEASVSIPVGPGRWLPVAAVGADFPTRFEIPDRGIEGTILRGDLGLGLRYRNTHRQLVPWLDGLVMGRVARWRGRGLVEDRTAWHFTPGFRLAAGLGLRWHRALVPCLEARGAWYPVSSAVTAQPGGSVGRTAVVEVGIAVGARWLP